VARVTGERNTQVLMPLVVDGQIIGNLGKWLNMYVLGTLGTYSVNMLAMSGSGSLR